MLSTLDDIIPIISVAIDKEATFAICSLPGDDKFHIFLPDAAKETTEAAAPEAESCFEIGRWLQPYSHRIVIRNEVSTDKAIDILNSVQTGKSSQSIGTWRSTPRRDYIANVSSVVASCRRRKGKTVYSRVICGRIANDAKWADIFGDLCRTYTDTFRFIFHTPQTDSWMGATPEQLLGIETTTGAFNTVALAGTRRHGARGWDAKNIRENQFVSNYILRAAEKYCSSVKMSQPFTLAYGKDIEHICRTIEGKADNGNPIELLDAINPTPALCGSPKSAAVADIARLEPHARECYGGFVALRTARRIDSFVTLRCCRFNGRKIRIFAGGGITSESIPEKEWEETVAKSSFFRRYVEDFL